MQQKLVIIAAGGTGSRLNANLPKQYMLLASKPVLMRTIEAFNGIADKIVVAVHPEMHAYWKELCNEYSFTIDHEVITGGATRFQSVKNAIQYLREHISSESFANACIAIHDAARPLVDKNLILESFRQAQCGHNVTLAVKSTNSVRIGNQQASNSIDRDTVWQIQTPQTFPAQLVQEAYKQDEDILFTDDCSVVEKFGQSIQLIESTNRNIKLTFAEDFDIANIFLKEENN